MTTCTSRWQAAISLVAALGLSTLACSDTLTVCSSGCDYTDIQSAIDDASDGDVIEIAAGTYSTSSLGYLDTLGHLKSTWHLRRSNKAQERRPRPAAALLRGSMQPL